MPPTCGFSVAWSLVRSAVLWFSCVVAVQSWVGNGLATCCTNRPSGKDEDFNHLKMNDILVNAVGVCFKEETT